jgi:RimJ/RimL family protein N-acetyltransferase
VTTGSVEGAATTTGKRMNRPLESSRRLRADQPGTPPGVVDRDEDRDTHTPAAEPDDWTLRHFEPRDASVIAFWPTDGLELHWLAPSTPPPLTPEKVLAWGRPNGTNLILAGSRLSSPAGYAELNPMSGDPRHLWIGHLIVAPKLRGHRIGTLFVRSLLRVAFTRLAAHTVSLVVFPENVAATRCYERAGMCTCGEEHHRFTKGGPRYRLVRYKAESPPGR